MDVPVLAVGKPVPDLLRLVCRVVVHHQMHVQPFGHCRLDLPEEGKELLGAVTPAALPDHRPGGDVERGEERCRAVADVVAGSPLGRPRRHWQDRLRPVQSLDLRLLVDAQDDRAVRRAM